MAKFVRASARIRSEGKNELWEGFGRLTPICKCGAHMAQRFDHKPWRCFRGHFVKEPA